MDDWTCARCGTQNQDWRNWCQQCSGPRDQVRMGPAPASVAPAPKTPLPKGPIVAGVVILLAAALGGFLLTRGGDSNPEATVASTSSSSSSDGPTSTTISHRNPDQIAADDAAAHATVLQLTDMPPGFSAQPNEIAPEKGLSADHAHADAEFVACLGASVPTVLSDVPTYAASDVMVDDQDRNVVGEITMYANERIAKDDFELLKNRHFMECIGHVVDKTVAEGIGPRGVPPGVTLGPAYGSDLGDIGNVHADFVGVRAIVPLQAGQSAQREYLDIVYALKGRTIVTLSFDTFGTAFDVSFEGNLTNTIVDRAPAS